MSRTAIKNNKNAPAFTLAEVIIASLILIIAIVPILKALTGAHILDVKIEHKTRSLTLAEAKLEDIRARSIYSWSTSFDQSSLVLQGSYLCNVTDDVTGDLRSVTVAVGYDQNSDGSLATGEVEVTLETLIARRW